MIIATTGALMAGPNSPIVYRGSFDQIIPQMAEDGYSGVEMHIDDSDNINRKELWSLLTEYSMQLTSIGTGTAYGKWHWNISDHDKEVRNNAIACIKRHIITAQPSKAVVIIGCVQGRYKDAGSPDEFTANMEESLYWIDQYAKEMDVMIGFEIMNHYESDFLFNIKSGISFFKEHGYQNIGLHIDTVHMNIEETDMGGAIRQGKDFINHVHIADNDRYYPGHARINFKEILQALVDIDYQGALALETYCKPDTRTVGKRSLQYMNFLLDEIYEK